MIIWLLLVYTKSLNFCEYSFRFNINLWIVLKTWVVLLHNFIGLSKYKWLPQEAQLKLDWLAVLNLTLMRTDQWWCNALLLSRFPKLKCHNKWCSKVNGWSSNWSLVEIGNSVTTFHRNPNFNQISVAASVIHFTASFTVSFWFLKCGKSNALHLAHSQKSTMGVAVTGVWERSLQPPEAIRHLGTEPPSLESFFFFFFFRQR